MNEKCRCGDVTFDEGRVYKRVKGIGHSPTLSCAPNLYEDGYRDPPEEDENGDEKPVKRTKKVKAKKFKSCMSNGLRNSLIMARHGAAFEEQIAPYCSRPAERELIAWASSHTCVQLRKFKAMGGKKFGELIKLVQRQTLRLACGCPCTGEPLTPQAAAMGAPACGCPTPGSEAWERGERCEEHQVK